jgi:16S rRNA (guanine527-N7)-methyltransferase
MTSAYQPSNCTRRLNEVLTSSGQSALDPELAARFGIYLELLMRWNARLNLTAIRDEEGILSRHFAESIACARVIPVGVANLLDFGSGAGFPGIPIALCRPEISVILAESQAKKAGFLREAVRTLALSAAVHAARAETLASRFDCVTMRAVDRMARAVETAARLVSPNGWLVLMTTERELGELQSAAGPAFEWSGMVSLPQSKDRIIALGSLTVSDVPRGTKGSGNQDR